MFEVVERIYVEEFKGEFLYGNIDISEIIPSVIGDEKLAKIFAEFVKKNGYDDLKLRFIVAYLPEDLILEGSASRKRLKMGWNFIIEELNLDYRGFSQFIKKFGKIYYEYSYIYLRLFEGSTEKINKIIKYDAANYVYENSIYVDYIVNLHPAFFEAAMEFVSEVLKKLISGGESNNLI